MGMVWVRGGLLHLDLPRAVFAVSLISLLSAGAAVAQTTVPDDWPLKPSGLSAGDEFRLLFVTTGTRDGTSSKIADYNDFVFNAASRGYSALRDGYADSFRALVSTSTVDARDNTGSAGGTQPIYWLGGAKAADNSADLYDGSVDSAASRNQFGVTVPRLSGDARYIVLTGTRNDGTRGKDFPDFANRDLTLGGSDDNVLFAYDPPDSGKFLFHGHRPRTGVGRLYALSSVFRVASSASPPTVSVSSSRESSGVTEGQSVPFRISVAGAGAGTRLDVRVKITDDSLGRGNFLDPGDEGVRTISVSGDGNHDFSLQTIGDSGDSSGGIQIEIVGGAGYVPDADDRKISLSIANRAALSSRTLSVADVAVAEGGVATFELKLSNLPSTGQDAATVAVSTAAGAAGAGCLATARAGRDYTALSRRTIRFPPGGARTAQVKVQTSQDTLKEGDEVICLKVEQPEHLILGGKKAIYAKATVADDDTPILISVSSPRVEEKPGAVLRFDVTLEKAPGPLTVSVDYEDAAGTDDAGTAQPGFDYGASDVSGTLTFTGAETRKSVNVRIVDHPASEPDETVVLKFGNAVKGGFADGARNLFATGTIVDNDTGFRPRLHLLESNVGINPKIVAAYKGESVVFNVGFYDRRARDEDYSFEWSTVDGTAKAGEDYTGVYGATAVLPAGKSSVPIEVRTLEDAASNGTKTFQVELIRSSGADILPSRARGEIWGGPTLSVLDAEGAEGETLVFPVRLGFAAAADLTVAWRTDTPFGHAAAAGQDYTAASGSLTLKAGETNGKISVSTLEDTLDESDETFTVVVSDPGQDGVTVGRERATGVILDDDPRPAITVKDASVTEGGKLSFPIALAHASGKPIVLRWQTSIRKTAGATYGEDYSHASGKDSGQISIPPGTTAASVEFATVDDKVHEPDEGFEFTLFLMPGGLVPMGSAAGVIRDDDLPTLAISDAEVEEPDVENPSAQTLTPEKVKARFVVRLSNASRSAVTVRLASEDGNARTPPGARTANALSTGTTRGGEKDYLPYAATVLTFNPGETEKAVDVEILGDTVIEDTESFRMVLSNPSGATLARAVGSGVVKDNDSNFFWIANEVRDVVEGQGIDVEVRRRGPSTLTESVSFRICIQPTGNGQGHAVPVRSGTLGSGTADVYLSASGLSAQGTVCTAFSEGARATILTFGPTDTSKSFTVQTIEDTRVEGDETFIVTQIGGLGHTATDQDSFPKTFTILDNEYKRIRVESVNSPWEGQKARFEVYLDDPGSFSPGMTVAFSTGDGSAKAGDDYTSAADVEVTLSRPANANLPAGSFTVDTKDDEAFEQDETFEVTLKDLPQGFLAVPGGISASATIRDNDRVRVFATNAVVDEGDAAKVEIRLGHAVSRAVEVTWKTVSGEAESPGDFIAVAAGKVTIPAGKTSAEVTVQTVEDNVYEGDEDFSVAVTATDYPDAAIGRAATVTVRDDETPVLTISGLSNAVVEENKAWKSGVPGLGKSSGVVTWTLEGDDAARFGVNSRTGVLTLAARDYEAPADKDKNNVYEVTLRATDEDKTTATRALTVTVADVGIVLSKTEVSLKEKDNPSTPDVVEFREYYTVTLTRRPASAVTVAVASRDSSVANAAPRSIPIIPARWNIPVRFSVDAAANRHADPENSLRTTIVHTLSGDGDFAGETAELKVLVEDDDTPPRIVDLSVDTDAATDGNQGSVAEGGGAKTVRVRARIRGEIFFHSDQTVQVTVGGEDDSAAEGVDYEEVEAFSLTIKGSEASASATFVLTPADDAVHEGAETIGVTGALSRVTVNAAAISIEDDDAAPSGIVLAVDTDGGEEGNQNSVSEDAGATTVTVTAEVTGGTAYADARTVRVTVGGKDDTAVSGTDYKAVAAFDIEIPEGAMSARGTFTLEPTDDDVAEDAESLTVGGASTGLTVTGASVEIADDDARGVTVTPAALTLAEADDPATADATENVGEYTVVLTSRPTATVTVTPTGAAAAKVSPASLTFPPEERISRSR